MTRRRPWAEQRISDEQAWLTRRRFLGALGVGGLAAAGLGVGGRALLDPLLAGEPPPPPPPLQAARNPQFADPGRPLTPEDVATRYNNFYEFGTEKQRVWELARGFAIDPYALEVGGLVERPGAIPLEQIEALGLEERVYRFRCVEAWAAVVPWTGVPLRALLEKVGVKPEAKFVAFTSFLDPERAPGQRPGSGWKWPYYEALRLDEALHELTLVATGIYGKRLPPQSGTPLRIVVPWKYGFKGPKSVVRMTLTAEQPRTFWNDAYPDEYPWLSNVDPAVPHPRWSQASEKMLGTGEEVPTLPFNGYGEQVAGLYAS